MSPALVSVAARVHDLLLRPGFMDAARKLAEACLADPEQSCVDALQFPVHPDAAKFAWMSRDRARERSFEGPPSLTPGQVALALAALHDVGCPHVENVIAIPADAGTIVRPADPAVDEPFMVSRDFDRAQRWLVIRDRVRGLGDFALDWFDPLLCSFERVLAELVPPDGTAGPVAPRVEVVNWDEGGREFGGWFSRLLSDWLPFGKGKETGKKESRGRGNPGLDEATRKKMVREYADYKASGLTQREYLNARGNIFGIDRNKSLAHLERCRKQWEKENRGK